MIQGIIRRRMFGGKSDDIAFTKDLDKYSTKFIEFLYNKGLCANLDYITQKECDAITIMPEGFVDWFDPISNYSPVLFLQYLTNFEYFGNHGPGNNDSKVVTVVMPPKFTKNIRFWRYGNSSTQKPAKFIFTSLVPPVTYNNTSEVKIFDSTRYIECYFPDATYTEWCTAMAVVSQTYGNNVIFKRHSELTDIEKGYIKIKIK